jgi:MFS transporter, OFA family, oxalate/formate antiporter
MKILKQYKFVIISVVMMLMMGTVYTYSVFRLEIENLFAVDTLLSGLPYMTSLSFYALSMMVSGRMLKPQRLSMFAFIGTLLIVLGFFLASVVNSILLFTLSYGVLIGTGVGMVYGVPIYMSQRTFREKSGFVSGVILLGFGMSPLITAPLSRLLIVEVGLKQTFFIFSIGFLIIQLPMTFLFKLSQDENHLIDEQTKLRVDRTIFRKLYFLFVIATTIGLMMIGLSYQIGVSIYAFDATKVTLSLSFFAIMNGIARPIFGRLMDHKGIVFTIRLSLFLMMIAAFIGLLNQGQYLWMYIVSFGLFWFNLGAWLAIVPAAIKYFYGIENFAKIYGLIFTAYGVGAILGTFVSGIIIDYLNVTSNLYFFIVMIILLSLYQVATIKKIISS